MKLAFNIDSWAAWAPGLDSAAAWQAWSRSPMLPAGDAVPSLEEVPAMTRRRMSRLGRIALQTSYRAHPAGSAENNHIPLVFASRHSDVNRSSELLRERAETGSISPASFSVSVHNAIGGLFSIVRNDTSPLSAVAAGIETPEAAIVEACGLLAEGASSVLVTVYDDDMLGPYATFADEPRVAHAWTLRISAQGQDMIDLRCGEASASADNTPPSLPHSLAILQFLLSDSTSFGFTCGARHWVWSRRG